MHKIYLKKKYIIFCFQIYHLLIQNLQIEVNIKTFYTPIIIILEITIVSIFPPKSQQFTINNFPMISTTNRYAHRPITSDKSVPLKKLTSLTYCL